MTAQEVLIEALKSMSVKDAAMKSGVAKNSIYGWLNGEREPSFGNLIAVINACGFYLKMESIEK